MERTTTPWERLRRYADDHAPFEEVWDAVQDDTELLRVVVRDAYRSMCRQRTRDAEHRAFDNCATGTTVADIRRELHDEGFILDGEWIAWLDATDEQHEQRAESLERIAAGYLRTARSHRDAAKMIREAGVTCLRDL